MILELDIGNTQAKWRIVDEGGVIARGHGEVADWLRTELPAEWSRGVSRIRVASVVGQGVESSLARVLQVALGLPVEFARSRAEASGLRNAYVDPQSLGVDRWLALLAAYNLAGRAALVVDIGSALTIDLVDKEGMHLGGYIIPGPRLMQNALLRDTDRVRFAERDSLSDLAFGRHTADCVGAGIAAAQVGAVVMALKLARAAVGEPVHLYITGGWGSELGERLSEIGFTAYERVPELVLDGLRWALP